MPWCLVVDVVINLNIVSSQQQNLLRHVQVHLTCVNSAKFSEFKVAWDIMHKIGLNGKMLCYAPFGLKAK